MRRRRDDGTATLEVVGMLPVVAMVIGVMTFLAAVAWTVNGANVAARDGARAASLGRPVVAAVNAALPGGLTAVTTMPSSHTVTVVVTLDALPSLRATRTVTMS